MIGTGQSVTTLVAALVALVASPALALFPAPHNLTAGTTPLTLSPAFQITLGTSFMGTPPHDVLNRTFSLPVAPLTLPPMQLVSALGRAHSYALEDKLEPLIINRGESLRSSVESSKGSLKKLELNLLPGATMRSLRDEVSMPFETRDEAYTLDIPGGEVATISANSTLGLLRGLQSFSQLVYVLPAKEGCDATRFLQTTPLLIMDKPAFPHR